MNTNWVLVEVKMRHEMQQLLAEESLKRKVQISKPAFTWLYDFKGLYELFISPGRPFKRQKLSRSQNVRGLFERF